MIHLAKCGCKNVEMDKLYGDGLRKHSVGTNFIKCLSCGRTYVGTIEITKEDTDANRN